MGLFKPAHLRHVFVVYPSEPERSEVLLVRGSSGQLELPSFVAEESHPADAAYLRRALRRLTGLDAHVLGSIVSVPSRLRVYAVEADGTAAPAPSAAFHRSAGLSLAAEERSWVEAGVSGGAPWAQRGYWARVVCWVQHCLEQRGFGSIEAIEQVRTWEFSSVIRFSAGGADHFFKACPRHGVDEGRLVQQIALRAPERVARIIAREPEERWVLFEGVVGPCFENVAQLPWWQAAARAYAELQLAYSSEEVAAELGLERVPTAPVIDALEALLATPEALLLDDPAGLERGELERLSALVPGLRASCQQLERYGDELRLDHGDLWASNVIMAERGPVFIDWADAVACHPFLGAYLFFEGPFLEDQFGERAAQVRPAITDAYLQPYIERSADEAGVRACFALAREVAPAFHAVRFHREQLPRLRTPELIEIIPYHLRRLLSLQRAQRDLV